MSHSIGAVKFQDNTIYFFEYNGTVDVCLPQLYKTQQEVFDNWRNQKWEHHNQNCPNSEDAIMTSTYGGGFGWTVKACKNCMLITDWHGHESLENDTYYDGLAEWYPKNESED